MTFLGGIATHSTNAPGGMIVSITPSPSYKTRIGTGSITSDVITATVTGGTSPYTFAVTYVSGDSLTVNTPAAAASTFTTSLTKGTAKTGYYRFTATDAAAATANAITEITLEAPGNL